jgi:hypothetical protein
MRHRQVFDKLERRWLLCNVVGRPRRGRLGYVPAMRVRTTIREARLKSLRSEMLRARALVATRRAQEVRQETLATRAEIQQRRRADARRPGYFSGGPRAAAPR